MPEAKPRFPRFDRLGESALLVTFGSRISEPLNDRVHALDQALRRAELSGIIDQVPAYSSLLVRFDPAILAEPDLREAIDEHLQDAAGHGAGGRLHTIPVHYGGSDGPDLHDIAASHGLTTAEVVRLHTSREYRVYFLGFLPGFAYLGRVPGKIATPRLDSPRVRVPAGTVAVAGYQTAVYPLDSPGGWRLIGRTATPVWDLGKADPAILAPGDSVRFAGAGPGSVQQPGAVPRVVPRDPVFEVESASGLTTVQDQGRPGLGRIGLAQGGASDAAAMARANGLVGNPRGAAVLELTWAGPSMVALRSTTIALEGADLGCRADGNLVPTGISWFVRSGTLLRFSRSSAQHSGARGYLAVAGGFEVPRVLGSSSTFLPASFGGYEGRPLRQGDLLDVGPDARSPGLLAGRYWLGPAPALPRNGEVTLRFTAYDGPGGLRERIRREFCQATWRVGAQSNRMGLRLEREEGPALSAGREVVSFGVVRGTIQLPPGGSPIVLNVDHQTTGGYPLLGVVIEADWPALAQLMPDDTVRFVVITCEEARTALTRSRAELQKGLELLDLGG